VNYRLSFLDETSRAGDAWDARFEAEHPALSWMWVAGGTWAQHRRFAAAELWCRRCRGQRAPCPRVPPASGECCIARLPASALRRAAEPPAGRQRARPVVLLLEPDAAESVFHEGMLLAGGFSPVSFADCASAGKWLAKSRADAAIIDVKPGERSCAGFARKLCEREIPLLAVSHYPAGTTGVDRIFRPMPWLEKPLSPRALHLALRSIL